VYGELFHDVQMQAVFTDSKTFADCLPIGRPEEILARYELQKQHPDFSLPRFVQLHFKLPPAPGAGYVSDQSATTLEHIERMWPHLTRQAEPNTSLLPVPHPYIVPGGRFRGLYYWDSYFTMLGLVAGGRTDFSRGMVDNFAHLIETFGHIPNANRTYFLSRSQPPYFARMVRLLAETDGPTALARYLPQLQKEYNFWMDGRYRLHADDPCFRRVVWLNDGTVLNRYWDDLPAPRPEMYREDVLMARRLHQSHGTAPEVFYRHVRAACESGWDFSSRWFGNDGQLETIRTTAILPVDLNCLLFDLECTLADAYRQADSPDVAAHFDEAARDRHCTIQTIFWDESARFFLDYDTQSHQRVDCPTLAGVYPLFVGIATPAQAGYVHERLRTDFLKKGGLVTSLCQSGHQWDTPNGWAPLQWLACEGLRRYGYGATAQEIEIRWLALNDKVFGHTGKMTEKYNVVDDGLPGGGGEYPNQDGFGWTNGVYQAFRLQNSIGQSVGLESKVTFG